MPQALIVIDIQNDYFPGGAFPLWNAEGTLENVVGAIERAGTIPVVLVQHIADEGSPFFVRGTPGAELHPRLRAAAPDAPVVVKRFADSFLETELGAVLDRLGATELLVCGMMTQNCVVYTAISRASEKYGVTILADACTTVSEILHRIALDGVSRHTRLAPWREALA